MEPGCTDLQDGFTCGMPREITGLWAGNEKYKDDAGVINDYCSRTMFHTNKTQEYNGAYLGTGQQHWCSVSSLQRVSRNLTKTVRLTFPLPP